MMAAFVRVSADEGDFTDDIEYALSKDFVGVTHSRFLEVSRFTGRPTSCTDGHIDSMCFTCCRRYVADMTGKA